MNDFHDDPLNDLFIAAGERAMQRMEAEGDRAQTEHEERARHQARAAMERFVENCPKCGGSGMTRWGTCFKCQGRGRLTFSTPPAQRAAERRETQRVERAREANEWRAAHQAEVTWLTAAAERQHENAHRGRNVWQFPIDLANKLAEWGTLTDGQLGAIRKCMVRDAERRAERQQVATAATPAVSTSALEEAFNRARSAAAADGEGIKMLHLRLDTFVFSPAPASGRNAGAIYVKENRVYLGKLVNGQFHRARECIDDQATRIVAAIADPATAARAYGLRTGTCGCCGRELTNRISIDRGIGPICAERYGF